MSPEHRDDGTDLDPIVEQLQRTMDRLASDRAEDRVVVHYLRGPRSWRRRVRQWWRSR